MTDAALTRLPDPARPAGEAQTWPAAASWAVDGAGYLAVAATARNVNTGQFLGRGLQWFRRDGDRLTRLPSPYPLAPGNLIGAVAFTASGSHLAVVLNDRLRLLRRDGDRLTPVAVAEELPGQPMESFQYSHGSLAWDATGTVLGVIGQQGSGGADLLHLYRRTGDTLTAEPNSPYDARGDGSGVAFGGGLLAATGLSGLRVWRHTGQLQWPPVADIADFELGLSVSLHPAGTLVATVANQGSGGAFVALRGGPGFTTGLTTLALRRHLWMAQTVAFDPSGRYLAAGPCTSYPSGSHYGLRWVRVEGATGAVQLLASPAPADDSYASVLSWGRDGDASYLLAGGFHPTHVAATPLRSHGFCWYRVGSPSQLQAHTGDGLALVGTGQRPAAVMTGDGWRTWPGSSEALQVKVGDGTWKRVL